MEHYCWTCKTETDHRANTSPDFLVCTVCGKPNWADDYPIGPTENPANPLIAARQYYQNERNVWKAAHLSEWVESKHTDQNVSLVVRVLALIEGGSSGQDITGDLELMQDGYFTEREYWQGQGNERMSSIYQALWDLASETQAHISRYWLYEKVR